MAVDQNNGPQENYEDLLEDYSHFAPPAADEVLQGTVLGITAKDVIIDFGYKSEGIVPIEQFLGPTGQVTVQIGDAVDVMIEHGEQPEHILFPEAGIGRTGLLGTAASSPTLFSTASGAYGLIAGPAARFPGATFE